MLAIGVMRGVSVEECREAKTPDNFLSGVVYLAQDQATFPYPI